MFSGVPQDFEGVSGVCIFAIVLSPVGDSPPV